MLRGLPWRQTPGESRAKRRGSNRQVRRGADQRHPKGHSGICSQASIPCRPAAPLYPLVFKIKHTWRTGWGDSGKSRGTPLWQPRSTASRFRWPIGWTSGGTNSGAMRWNHAPESEPKLTSPSDVVQAIRGLEIGKDQGPTGIPNRILRHLPKRAITFLAKVFNAVLCRQYFPSAWKHARVVSLLKPGKDPMPHSSCRPIRLLDTACKLFEKILLDRVLRDVTRAGFCVTSSLGFDPDTARRCS
jgi:hypothetical protein